MLADGEHVQNELAVFAEAEDAIEFEADADTEFIVSSAVKHPYDLVLGNYSVHTSKEALVKGESEIARIGQFLRAKGRIP